jgi:hypothetical protein
VDYDEAVRLDPRLAAFDKSLGNIAALWDGTEGFCFPRAKEGRRPARPCRRATNARRGPFGQVLPNEAPPGYRDHPHGGTSARMGGQE